jgi:hypothetical protein
MKATENKVRVTIESEGNTRIQDGSCWVIVGCIEDYRAMRGIVGDFDAVSKLIMLTELKKVIHILSDGVSEEDLAIVDMLAARADDTAQE